MGRFGAFCINCKSIFLSCCEINHLCKKCNSAEHECRFHTPEEIKATTFDGWADAPARKCLSCNVIFDVCCKDNKLCHDCRGVHVCKSSISGIEENKDIGEK